MSKGQVNAGYTMPVYHSNGLGNTGALFSVVGKD